MCINLYNIKDSTLEVNNLSLDEINLLKSIYSSIKDNNIENIKTLTKELMEIQNPDNVDKIKFLEGALNTFN